MFEIHWGWPLAIIASLLYAWLSRPASCTAVKVNVFFAGAAPGCWQCGCAAIALDPMHRCHRPAWVGAASPCSRPAGQAAWLACAMLLRAVTDSDVAWADGFVTADGVVGTVLLGRKLIENWPRMAGGQRCQRRAVRATKGSR